GPGPSPLTGAAHGGGLTAGVKGTGVTGVVTTGAPKGRPSGAGTARSWTWPGVSSGWTWPCDSCAWLALKNPPVVRTTTLSITATNLALRVISHLLLRLFQRSRMLSRFTGSAFRIRSTAPASQHPTPLFHEADRTR